MNSAELDQVLRARDRRRSRNAVLAVLGLVAFFAVLVGIRVFSDAQQNRPVPVRSVEDMKAAR